MANQSIKESKQLSQSASKAVPKERKHSKGSLEWFEEVEEDALSEALAEAKRRRAHRSQSG